MNLQDVRKGVERVRAARGDNEAAHAAEDHLVQDVLKAIADDPEGDSAELAREALKVYDLDYERWYA